MTQLSCRYLTPSSSCLTRVLICSSTGTAERNDYTFWCQYDEKTSGILGCPGAAETTAAEYSCRYLTPSSSCLTSILICSGTGAAEKGKGREGKGREGKGKKEETAKVPLVTCDAFPQTNKTKTEGGGGDGNSLNVSTNIDMLLLVKRAT